MEEHEKKMTKLTQRRPNLNLPPPDSVLPPAASPVQVSSPERKWRWLWHSFLCPGAPPSGEEWYSRRPAEPGTRHSPRPVVPQTPRWNLSPPSARRTHAFWPREQYLSGWGRGETQTPDQLGALQNTEWLSQCVGFRCDVDAGWCCAPCLSCCVSEETSAHKLIHFTRAW